MRYKMLLAYEGTDYSGWQIQENSNPPPTIQGTLEEVLFKLTGEKIRISASGRTDAGVHAHGQVAHFTYHGSKLSRLPDLRKTFNAVLPHSIRILEIGETAENFHSRKDALSKTYIYQFWQDLGFIPPFLLNWSWQCGKVDLKIFHETAALFKGTHDFASFQNAGSDCDSTERTILSMQIAETGQIPFYPPHLPMISLQITATGFLKQMVRNIAGFIVFAAQKKIDMMEFEAILAKRNRKYLPSPTAPARGLSLLNVNYPD